MATPAAGKVESGDRRAQTVQLLSRTSDRAACRHDGPECSEPAIRIAHAVDPFLAAPRTSDQGEQRVPVHPRQAAVRIALLVTVVPVARWQAGLGIRIWVGMVVVIGGAESLALSATLPSALSLASPSPE
ncbi:hypothetical protein [Cupriavidus lacunae]|uniref:Uncharacterized protein n=1 Tax=Cupriavidus lacunae TaxID=2666307 RepID=A0A370NHR8_9BURK|nr:hypothetical protein [Cupriavidus lacunae]RDK05125.1 hypothetical protein DN412_38705 [Cupriavidus lacunae]